MFKLSLDSQFEEKLQELRSKYGEEMMMVEGMSNAQLDTNQFFANFMNNNTVADASIDDNANVSGKNINTMINESQKPFLKLLSRNKIYIEMKEEFGKAVADEFLDKAVNGQIYEHDSHLSSYLPYCFAFSVKPIVEKGLFFDSIYNILKQKVNEGVKVYFMFDEGFNNIQYFTVERDQIKGKKQEFYLCGWDEEHSHLNYGQAPNGIKELDATVIKYYLDSQSATIQTLQR